MGRNTQISIGDKNGRQLAIYKVPYGAKLFCDNNEKVKKEIEVIPGDIRDFDCVKSATQKCDYIFNLAALIGIPYSYEAPNSYLETNIKGLLNVMNAVKEKNSIVKDLIEKEVVRELVNQQGEKENLKIDHELIEKELKLLRAGYASEEELNNAL